MIQQAFFHPVGPHHARRDHHLERVQSIGLTAGPRGIERRQHRPGEHIADQGHLAGALRLGQLPHDIGIEMRVIEQQDRAAHGHRQHGTDPHAGAVHQRAGGNRARRLAGVVQTPGEGRKARRVSRGLDPAQGKADRGQRRGKVALLVHHAFGHTGGAAGVKHVDILAGMLAPRLRLGRGERRLVVQRPVQMLARSIGHFQKQLHLGQPFANRGNAGRKPGLKHQGLAV